MTLGASFHRYTRHWRFCFLVALPPCGICCFAPKICLSLPWCGCLDMLASLECVAGELQRPRRRSAQWRARTAGTSELGGELTYQRFSCSGVMAARQPRNSPACKGKSLRCLRKRRFSYIDTSPALSARRDVTAALRYSARLPQRPSRLHLGCQTHQTYYFAHLQSRPRRGSPVARTRFKTLIYLKGFGVGACGGVGVNEQIFGADEQNLGRGQSD